MEKKIPTDCDCCWFDLYLAKPPNFESNSNENKKFSFPCKYLSMFTAHKILERDNKKREKKKRK